MENSQIIQLIDRGILAITGDDRVSFLQGAITQDIKKCFSTSSTYGAHLTPQGKFLYDFFIVEDGDKILIDCNKDELMELAKSLHKYTTGRKVEFHDMSEDYDIYAELTAHDDEPGLTSREDNMIKYADPRLKEMGYRLITPKTWEAPIGTTPLDHYHAHRITIGVPDGSFDALKGRTLPNELGLGDINGISFNKGCYVGQELTARTKFRTEPKKKVFIAQIQSDLPDFTPGTSIMRGKVEAGWAFSRYNDTAIIIIRTREIDNKLTLNEQEIHISSPIWANLTS